MKFIADKQSLEDLNLLGKYKSNSIYSLFNQTKTTGGEKLLEKWFLNPLMDSQKINERTQLLKHLQDQDLQFPCTGKDMEAAEYYLREGRAGNYLTSSLRLFQKKISNSLFRSEEYNDLLLGLQSLIKLLQASANFIEEINFNIEHPFQGKIQKAKGFFQKQQIRKILEEVRETKSIEVKAGKLWEPQFSKLTQYHYTLTYSLQEELHVLLQTLYELDLYIAVANVARDRNMYYATALPANHRVLQASGLRHPALEKAKSNNIHLHQEENVLFLTGANMAGKSTWMKTIGTSMYLAHLGMPIAAESFEFSIMEGIYSSINVPDDLNQGYSHFYAEVLRVKEVAQQVSEGKNLLVLFDELFKGTNVKDAYDATLAVTDAFAAYTNCLFVISTHIIEVGEALGKQSDNIQFRYLPTVMEGSVPRYTYQLTEGITTDRQGMMIIENEGILEIIQRTNKIKEQ
ncbi:MutS-related protein [Sphingobacterium faecale]|uniref:DNA mismatch repair protein n=1 Tax=Sphingobacterium faecale TaxID=2803775 RepID=A0ABS1R0L9_9SPHI|nr:DNA mismatch repair protein [Sphingobacterium faecale]MBL1408242.1 DNA mismatch repair protein [Sphingobacterium faecale]